MIYMGEGAGGALSREKSRDVLGEPRNTLKQEDSSELTLAFVIMPIIANNDKM